MNSAFRFRSLTWIVAYAISVSVPAGRGETLTAVPSRSLVRFSLEGSLHTVHGQFQVQSGKIEFDRKTHSMSGSIVIATGSGESGNDTRDRRMRTDILRVPEFAVAQFEPKSMEGTISPSGDSNLRVQGSFTLAGTAHELTLPMLVHIEGTHCTVKSSFTVPYVKWGLKDPSTFVFRVAKEVPVEVELYGELSGD